MTGSNKILTVSYGTFSCTLEGFDEPFEAMRGIAEYFRDLAADDRYFGAEPPTPDMEMLQSIAQREVHRRVEARASETGVALTQAAPAAAPSAPTAQTAPTENEELDNGPLTFDDEYLMSDEPEDILTVDNSVPAAEETEAVESVAEKLRRIRAVVSRSIEPGESPNSFSDAPVEPVSAGAGLVKDRAKTHTINSITADLSDDDYFEDADEDASVFESEIEEDDLDDNASDLEALDDLARLDGVPETSDEGTPESVGGEEAEELADEETTSDDKDVSLIANVLKQSEEDDADDTSATDSSSRREISGTDDNVDRLLKQTDAHLADDAGIRRRRVISQMRAAVAATKAERVLSRVIPGKKALSEETTAYRNDLKKAISKTNDPEPKPVRPQQVETRLIEPQEPEGIKPPPLVLVSSQRVDEPSEEQASTASTDARSFSEFAKAMGANELPDLMEAAAAYTSFVEGQSHFSRPEIMKRVAAVDPALEISREAGLRSFGQLLRQGKIRKLDRGQFVIDEETRFNPDQRIAGQ